MVRLAALAVWIWLSGCTLRSRVECHLHGGQVWREISSKHILVQTNADVETATALVHQLDRVRQALLVWIASLGLTEVEVPTVSRLIALRRLGELEEFTPDVAGFVQNQDGQQTVVILAENPVWSVRPRFSIPIHEMVHDLTRHHLSRQPRWLSEGLASFAENLEVFDDGFEIPTYRVLLENTRDLGQPSLESLWAWSDQALSLRTKLRLYAASWFWVHYLSHKRPEEFRAFLARMRSPNTARHAWNQTFVHPALEAEAQSYLESDVDGVLRFPLSPIPSTVEVREISPSSVHRIRARLLRGKPGVTEDEIRREIDMAQSLDAESRQRQ